MNETDRSIRNYTDTLENSGLIIDTTKRHGVGEYAHNVYLFDELKEEYFIIDPALITEQSISVKLKGLLMLIKSYCVKGTNYIEYKNILNLSKILHVGKNQLSGYLKELEAKDFISYIGDTLHLSQDFFKLYLVEDTYNLFYKTIYDYCLSLNVVPPNKVADREDIGLLVGEFLDVPTLLYMLRKRCPKLPQKPSMNYLIQALTNRRIKIKETTEHEFIID